MSSLRGLLGRKNDRDRSKLEGIDSERITGRLERIMQRDDPRETAQSSGSDRITDGAAPDPVDDDHEGV